MILFILLPIFALLYFEYRYFKYQKKECEKYAFYKVRDNIISDIILNGKSEYYKDYVKINNSIRNFRAIDFKFYSKATATALDSIIEQLYNKKPDINNPKLKHWKEFVLLMISYGRKNSFLIRLVTTKKGKKIFLYTHFITAIIRFIKKHPELLKKNNKVEITGKYIELDSLNPV